MEKEYVPESTMVQLRRAIRIVDEMFGNEKLKDECKMAQCIAVLETAFERALEKSHLNCNQKVRLIDEFAKRRTLGVVIEDYDTQQD